MAIQTLLDEVDGLEKVPDSTLEAIATVALIEVLQGTPLNPSATRQSLVSAAAEVSCLKRQEVLALFVRKLLDLLQGLLSGGAFTGDREFITLTDMLSDVTNDWSTAMVLNYSAGDGILTEWRRLRSSTLVPNGGDILLSGDGETLLIRTFLLENV